MKKVFILVVILFGLTACNVESQPPKSDTGVTKASAKIKTGADGLTEEQRNVKQKIELENMPGSIKYLYVISAYSGDVILYSSVKGKVTSSGKRLTPTTVAAQDGDMVGRSHFGMPVNIGGLKKYTAEVLQDDGTYGTSIPYLYWWDNQGRYHQHYVSGGQIIHISDQPIKVGRVIINVEATE